MFKKSDLDYYKSFPLVRSVVGNSFYSYKIIITLYLVYLLHFSKLNFLLVLQLFCISSFSQLPFSMPTINILENMFKKTQFSYSFSFNNLIYKVITFFKFQLCFSDLNAQVSFQFYSFKTSFTFSLFHYTLYIHINNFFKNYFTQFKGITKKCRYLKW